MTLGRIGAAPAIFGLTLIVFLASPLHTPTDSTFSALVSENLLRHGSFALDRWFPDGGAKLPYQVERIGAHVYPWYPPGGPVLSAPLVGILALLGLSAIGHDGGYDAAGDLIVQAILAALLMAVLAVVFLRIAQAILPAPGSWIVALGGAFGTQVWSTASRSLWGDTFLLLIVGAVIWVLVLHETGKRPLSPSLLATLLAWAYFVRPTASVVVAAVTLYVVLYHRRALFPFGVVAAGWMAAFVAWSWLTFGRPLPSYYRIHAFSFATLGTGLAGILWSPSRGELIFVPAILFVTYLVVRYARALPLPRLLAPALVAVLGHIALCAAFRQWHGGYSYGPRLLTPLVPWLVLLSAMGLRARLARRGRGARIELTVGAVLLACSVFVHARGACARQAWTWNGQPADLANDPDKLWSWHDPQFLAGLVPIPQPRTYPPYRVGTRLDATSAEAEPYFRYGWSPPEPAFRWTDGHEAEIAFALDSIEALDLGMELEGFLPRRRAPVQRVEIQLNGHELETVKVSRPGTIEINVELPAAAIRRENRLTLRLPDAAFASPFGLGRDPRQLAVAVHWLVLRPSRGDRAR